MSDAHLPDDVTQALTAVIQNAFKQSHLHESYGPADRYGVTEWVATLRRPDLDDALLLVSVAGWPNAGGVDLELAVAIRTKQWITRSTVIEDHLPVEDIFQPTGRSLSDYMTDLVAQALKSKFVEGVESHMRNPGGYDPPAGAKELLHSPGQ